METKKERNNILSYLHIFSVFYSFNWEFVKKCGTFIKAIVNLINRIWIIKLNGYHICKNNKNNERNIFECWLWIFMLVCSV